MKIALVNLVAEVEKVYGILSEVDKSGVAAEDERLDPK
jgi:hypothetical protein